MKGGMIGGTKETQKKKARPLKKAPQAPKRFKSSYILFFIHAQDGIKKSLPKGQASVSLLYLYILVLCVVVQLVSDVKFISF